MAAFKIALMFLFSSATLLSLVRSQAFDYHKYCLRTTVGSVAARCLNMIDTYPNEEAKKSPNGVCAIVQDVTQKGAKGMKALIQGDLGKNPTPRQKTSLQVCLDRAITIDSVVGQINCNVINNSTYPTVNRLLGIALDSMDECIKTWGTPPAIPNMFPSITTQQNEFILVDLQLINLFVCDKPTVCN